LAESFERMFGAESEAPEGEMHRDE
jgi:hypothetical protein